MQIHYKLERPLDELLMKNIRDAQAVYGIERIKLSPDLAALTVEYDATRLQPPQVTSVLRCAGLPIAPA